MGSKIWLSIPGMGKSCLRSPSRPGCLWVPASLIFSGAICFSIKRSGREFDHYPTSSAEVKNDRNNTSATRNAVVAWTGTNLPRTWTNLPRTGTNLPRIGTNLPRTGTNVPRSLRTDFEALR